MPSSTRSPFPRPAALGFFIATLALLTWCFPPGAAAAPVAQLYSAEVPVADQSAEERNRAIREAFLEVLVKVTGSTSQAARAGSSGLADQAQRFVQQYRYGVAPSGPGAPAPGGDPEGDGRLLWVQFDGDGLVRLLRDNRLPVWGDNRPLVLVWLAVESGGSRRLVLPDGFPDLVQGIASQAADRGIPILFPLMDLEDQDALPVSDLWGGFVASIEGASARYRPDLVLVGRVSKVGKRIWRANWSLYQDGRAAEWRGEGDGLEAVGRDAMQQTANRLADRYAPAGGETALATMLVGVAGVGSLRDHVSTRRYLESLSPVESLETARVEPETAVFRVRFRGVPQTLERELELGGVLQPDPEARAEQPPDAPNTLFYRLRR